MKKSVLIGCAAAGMTVALCACSGTSHSGQAASPATSGPAGVTLPASPRPAAVVPAGDQLIGGAAQGISMAVPSSWVAVNLAQQTLKQAADKIGLHGVASATLMQDMEEFQKAHAAAVYDIKSAVDSSSHFATNLDAYCVSSGVTETGSAGIALLRQEVPDELQTLGAANIAMRDVEVGGVPGMETTYTLSSADGTLDSAQLEVLSSVDRGRYARRSCPGQAQSPIVY